MNRAHRHPSRLRGLLLVLALLLAPLLGAGPPERSPGCAELLNRRPNRHL